VNGYTHDNDIIKIRESHENTFKVNPLSFFAPSIITGSKPIDYENRKSTHLQIGHESIRKHEEDHVGKTLVDVFNIVRPFPFGR
jgi:hypothetical protein